MILDSFRKTPYTQISRGLFFACFIVISYLAFTPLEHTVSTTFSDKLNHLAAFLVLAGLLDFSFPHSGFTWRKVLPLIGYGLAIECIQYLMPYREFSLLDLLADCVGIGAYSVGIWMFSKVFRKTGQHPSA